MFIRLILLTSLSIINLDFARAYTETERNATNGCSPTRADTSKSSAYVDCTKNPVICQKLGYTGKQCLEVPCEGSSSLLCSELSKSSSPNGNGVREATVSDSNASQMQSLNSAVATQQALNNPGGAGGGKVGKSDANSEQKSQHNGAGYNIIRSKVPGQLGTYDQHLNACREQWADTMKWCNEEKSTSTGNMIENGALITDIAAPLAMGMIDACSKFATVVKVAQGTVAAFRANCAMQMAGCETECSKAKKALSAVKSAWDQELRSNPPIAERTATNTKSLLFQEADQGNQWLKEEIDPRVEGTYAAYNVLCSNKQEVIKRATMNVMSLGAQMIQAKACEDDVSATAKSDVCKEYPSLPGCAANTKVDCSLAENKNAKDCICKENPRDPICTGASYLASTPNSGFGAPKGKDSASLASKKPSDFNPEAGIGGSGTGFGFGGGPSSGARPSGSSSNGIGSGGGAGALGGGSGGGGSAGSAGGGALEDKEDTNVSGGSRGGSPASTYTRGNYGGRNPANYGAYLPGGALDPSKNRGSNDGLTGKAGPSLFDKVGNRYRDNRSTLVPE